MPASSAVQDEPRQQEPQQPVEVVGFLGAGCLLSDTVCAVIRQLRFDPNVYTAVNLIWRSNLIGKDTVIMQFCTVLRMYDYSVPKLLNEMLAAEHVQLHWLRTVNRQDSVSGQVVEFALEPYNVYSYEALHPYKFPLAEALADLLDEKEYALLFNVLESNCKVFGTSSMVNLTHKLFPPLTPPKDILSDTPDI